MLFAFAQKSADTQETTDAIKNLNDEVLAPEPVRGKLCNEDAMKPGARILFLTFIEGIYRFVEMMVLIKNSCLVLCCYN